MIFIILIDSESFVRFPLITAVDLRLNLTTDEDQAYNITSRPR